MKGIAGERIWVELRKIVVSRFADSLVTRMQDTGVLKHIGFPHTCNLFEFSRVYRYFHDDLTNIPAPVSMICALLHNFQEVGFSCSFYKNYEFRIIVCVLV